MEHLSQCDRLDEPFIPNFRHEDGEEVFVRNAETAGAWLIIRADGTCKRVNDLELAIRYQYIEREFDTAAFACRYWLPDTLYLGWYVYKPTGERVCVRVGLGADPTYYIRTPGKDDLVGVRRRVFERQFRSMESGVVWCDRFQAPNGYPVSILQLDGGAYLLAEADGMLRPLSQEQLAQYRQLDPHTFWMVHCVGHTAPRKRHETQAQAWDEARRLARNSRGETFTVLQTVRSVCIGADEAQTLYEWSAQ